MGQKPFLKNKDDKWRIIAYFIGLFLLGIVVYYSYAVFRVSPAAVTDNGTLDLTKWQWDEKDTVELSGKWQFIENELVNPMNIAQFDKTLKQVPELWESRITGFGAMPDRKKNLLKGTYILNIKMKPTDRALVLKIPEIRMASKVYINGKLLKKQGQLNQFNLWDYARNQPFILDLPQSVKEMTVVIQVANLIDLSGGITHPLVLGDRHSVYAMVYLSSAASLIFSVMFFMLAIYLVFIFAITKDQKNDGAIFCLGIYMLFISLASLFFGERSLFYLLPPNFMTYFYSFVAALFILLLGLSLFYLWLTDQIKVSKHVMYIFLSVISLIVISAFCWPLRWQMTAALYSGIFLISFYFALLTWLLFQYNKKNHLIVDHRIMHFQLIIYVLLSLLMLDQLFFSLGWIHQSLISYVVIMVHLIIFGWLVGIRYYSSIYSAAELSRKLENSVEEKDQFLSGTALELKVPLQGIVAISESVLSSFSRELPDPVLQDLTHIHQSGSRLSLLVDELIDLNRMRNGTIILEKNVFDVSALISNIFEMLDYSLLHKDVKLVWEREDFPFLVQADENRVFQIIYNLMINAIQNTLEGQIEVVIDFNDKEEIIVAIEDTGTGIPESALGHIFEPFSKKHRGLEHSEGIGLGLSIAKQLAILNGGDITVTSEVGVGSCFTLALPSAKSETVSELLIHGWAMAELKRDYNDKALAEEVQPVVPLTSTGRVAHILVVDDDAAALRVYQSILHENNMTTLVTTSGKRALELLDRGHDFDAIVLDMMMPEISGYEVLKVIRARFNLYEMPVLMISGVTNLSEVGRCFELGANDMIQKPIDSNAFIGRLNTLTQLKKYVVEARNSEVAFLQAQIKPHFLFNTLNTIASLCVTDSEAAENLTLELAQFLRTTFDFNHMDSYVTLEREIEMVSHYLNIEKARFGDKLNYQIEVESDVSIMVPPLILQPLVENAVKHGVTVKRGGGKIWLKVSNIGNEVSFVIQDDGVGMSESKVKEVMAKESYRGVGLMNIELRLKSIYNTELMVFSQENIGTTVSFLLPNRMGTL